MPAIDCTRCFPPGNSGTSAYHQRESADGLSFLLHPRFSGVWFFSFDSMCDIVKLSSVRGRKPSVVCPCFLISNEFPARGRKPARLDDLIDVDVNYNLSPQGDGNFSLSQFIRLSSKLQFIPARGRKLCALPAAHDAVLLQFIPARGQKSTSATGVCQQRRCFAFSYILFYRLGAVPAGIVFVTGSALTPCGTSGFMGRISCR